MATSAETVEKLAGLLEPAGFTLGTLERVMLALKKPDDPEIMPKAQRGGGVGGVHLQARHLTNFLLGTAAADIVSHAASVVPVYRSLVPIRFTHTKTRRRGEGRTDTESTTFTRWLEPHGDSPPRWKNAEEKNLGEFLDYFISKHDDIATAHEKEFYEGRYPIVEFITWRAKPWAEITLDSNIGITKTFVFAPQPDLLSPHVMSSKLARPAGGCFSMPIEVFKILADLARDTERVISQKRLPDAACGKAA